MEAWKEEMYLKHHGILGMKWGKRQGPPYPLGASDHSAAERNAGYKKSLGGGRNESLYTRAKKKRLNKAADTAQRDADNLRKNGYKEEADAVQKVADKNREKAQNVTRLTDSQKKALKIGAAAVGTAIVAIGAYKVAKHLNNKATNALIEHYKDIGKDYYHKIESYKDNLPEWQKSKNYGKDSYFLKAKDTKHLNELIKEMNVVEMRLRNGKFIVKEKLNALNYYREGVKPSYWPKNMYDLGEKSMKISEIDMGKKFKTPEEIARLKRLGKKIPYPYK